ncbi:hypothetical protein [Cerasicoccus arenae]|uniref:Uncharacterized protein n=1 Tax=Cerasicoccus arenae TaxID=424488 RepID=A0A8J3DCV5_9BACT|nr:hypothetical protein [Cerasicoccus arenae]MBK1858082.1 hypothetical protein [Cerasicoccus arenae]GHC06975.1 hypothetical protein GCM10007047_25050 [Cerasicoccus arenae]
MPSSPINSFSKHIDQVIAQRRHTEQILEVSCPGHNTAEASVSKAWKSLYGLLAENAHPDITELNTLSAIIHKLTGAFTQLKALELKIREADLKQAEFDARRQQLEATIHDATRTTGLTPETIQEIERRLKLL